MIAWHPISTAPKDGTKVLLYPATSQGGIFVGYFRTWEYLDWEDIDKSTRTKTKRCFGEEWCYWRATYGPHKFHKVTHWAEYIDLEP